MTRLLVLPFRLMSTVGRPMGADLVRRYQEIGALLFDREFSFVDGNETIPLGIDLAWNSNLLSEMIDEKLIDSDHHYVLIDLSRPSQHSLQSHHLINGFLNAVNVDVGRKKGRRYLLLLPTMLPQEDFIRHAITELAERCEITVVANSGELLGRSQISSDRMHGYAKLVRTMDDPEIDSLAKKLIRFPGHFKLAPNTQGNACADYFFDGKLCEFEVVELIEGFIDAKFGGSDRVDLLYDAVISDWLEASVRAYCVRHDKPPINTSKMDEIVFVKSNANVLLVLPLIESGNTLRELLPKLHSMYPNSNLTVLSVLSTLGSVDKEGRIEGHDWGACDVYYLLKVRRNRYSSETCPSCKAGIPSIDPRNPDPFTKLSSHAFWTLAEDIGFGPENDVPPKRQPIGDVPQLRNLDPMNGTFLAYKIVKLLEFTNNKVPGVIILCPLEEGAHSIGSSLESVYNIPVVRVPKYEFDDSVEAGREDQVDDEENGLASIFDQEMETLWQTQLRTFHHYQRRLAGQPRKLGNSSLDVIIMDEFCRSGSTLSSLREFAVRNGLHVRCLISVISFGSNIDDLHSLYDISIPEAEVSVS